MDFISGALTDNSFLIFNKFLRSVDTVKIGDSAARISVGAPIPFEGPDGVETINYLQEYDGSLAYIDNNSLYLPGPNQLDRLKLNEFISSKDYALLAFATINSQNKVVNTLDSENEKGYFFLLDIATRDLILSELDFKQKRMKDIDFKLYDKIQEHIIVSKTNGATLTNPYYPYLFLEQGTLVVSYSFVNLIQVVSLGTKETISISPETNLYKTEKTLPKRTVSDLSFEEYYEISGDWQDDVLFGPIMRLGNSNYFRFVRESKVNCILEYFDQNFKKLGEINASSLENDLSMYYMPIGDRIFVKSKFQPNEEILNFFLIQVN
ncbi:hypothetical protein [Algoriphagus namhaensis]